MSVRKLLEEGSGKIGIDLEPVQTEKFLAYLELIKEWNRKINLTSITGDSDIIIKHFLDSLTVSCFIDDDSDVLDIGTGAGFPGIPLSIVRESLRMTLLDSREKRIFFLNEVIRKLQLSNVITSASRAEDLNNGIERNKFDYVLTRAVSEIGDVIKMSVPYLNTSGTVIMMRGKEGKAEWDRYDNTDFKLKHLRELKLPGTDYLRVLIVLNRK